MSENVQVAVRVRPFNDREREMNSTSCIRMIKETQQTIITDPETGVEKSFTFDFSYDSFVPKDDPRYASQEIVWEDVGIKVLEHAWEGFNVSLFAYGQTGAGKSYSMVGYGEDKGIIPKASEVIFQRIEQGNNPEVTFKVEASMMEIYNEKVKDLFNPSADNLKVRDHPRRGPYAEGLTRSAVSTYKEISELMDAGIMARTTASTNMNATSSRAHTIFQILITQSKLDTTTNKMTDKVSRLNLIDLAGSERAGSTGATGGRLKEGAAINQSLSALGNCISALADNANGKKKGEKLVPYRNSKLTHLLKDSLGGNAKTIMIAALSPASVNFAETLGTLRYADRAKQIKNQAVVNEDPNQKLIRQLKEELEALRGAMLQQNGSSQVIDTNPDTRVVRNEEKGKELLKIREQLEENQRLLQESEKSWNDKLKETEERAKAREEQLKLLGLVSNNSDLKEKTLTEPHLINLNEDQLMTEKLFYFLHFGDNYVGREDADSPQDIKLGGLGILKEHCIINRENDTEVLSMSSCGKAKVFINGTMLEMDAKASVSHCDRIILGNSNVFRMVVPHEKNKGNGGEPESTYDWQFAIKEMNSKQMNIAGYNAVEDSEQAKKERQEMEERVKQMKERMENEQKRAEEKINKQKLEWELHVKKLHEEMKYKEECLKSELHVDGKGNIDEEKLAKALANHEEKLAEELAKAGIEYEKNQKQLLKKQKELEANLQNQVEETKLLALRKEKEREERSKLDDQLLRSIPIVNEANSISEELQKNVGYSIKLITIPPTLSQLSVELGPTIGHITESIATDLKVQVSFQESGTFCTVMWDIDKFFTQICYMREIYQTFIENNRDLSAVACDGDDNPFYDPPAPQLIGHSFIYLNSLMHGIEIAETTPILDYRGVVNGSIAIKLTPKISSPQWVDEESIIGNKDFHDVESICLPEINHHIGTDLEIIVEVEKLQGIPGKLCKNAFVAFSWFEDSSSYVSDASQTACVDPLINYKVVIKEKLSEELNNYITNGVLMFEIYGNTPSSTLSSLPQEILPSLNKQATRKLANIHEVGDSDEKVRRKLAQQEEILKIQENTLMENTQELESAMHEVSQLNVTVSNLQAEKDFLALELEKMKKKNSILIEKLYERRIQESSHKRHVSKRKGLQSPQQSERHLVHSTNLKSPAVVKVNEHSTKTCELSCSSKQEDELLPKRSFRKSLRHMLSFKKTATESS